MKLYQIFFKNKKHEYIFCDDLFTDFTSAQNYLKDEIYPIMKMLNEDVAIDVHTRNLVVISSHYEWFVKEIYLDFE